MGTGKHRANTEVMPPFSTGLGAIGLTIFFSARYGLHSDCRLSLSGNSAVRGLVPEVGGDAFDPTRTSTSGACCSREADFYPYQSTCMRRTMRPLACRLDPSTTHIS